MLQQQQQQQQQQQSRLLQSLWQVPEAHPTRRATWERQGRGGPSNTIPYLVALTRLMRPSTANDTRAADELNMTIKEEVALAT
jgi:hypothetical protein